MRKVKVFGVSRSRDKTGKVVKRSLKEYIMCIHAQVGGGRENMGVYIAEFYENMEKYIMIPQATQGGQIKVYEGGLFDISYPGSKTRRGRVQGDGEISPTLTAQAKPVRLDKMIRQEGRPDGKGWLFDENSGLWFRVRRLTPKECYRLMGVSEENIQKIQEKRFIGKEVTPTSIDSPKAKPISNSQQFKMAGNSIVVDVLCAILKDVFIGL